MVDQQVEQGMNPATHNPALLGHLGVNLHLVQLRVVEEHDNLHQLARTMKTLLFYAMVRTKAIIIHVFATISKLPLNEKPVGSAYPQWFSDFK